MLSCEYKIYLSFKLHSFHRNSNIVTSSFKLNHLPTDTVDYFEFFWLVCVFFHYSDLDQLHLKSQLWPRWYCLVNERHAAGLVISQSHSRSPTQEKKKQIVLFFFILAHWGRKNIALRLTSNQIALGFHSPCPHSICTNHHRPTWISHPGWGILAPSPQ